MTERVHHRIRPLLALTLVFGAFFFLIWAGIVNSPLFTEILAFSATLLGAIVGHYFSGAHNENLFPYPPQTLQARPSSGPHFIPLEF